MKPFYVKSFINTNIFNWNDFNFLIKNHDKNNIQLIDKKCIKQRGITENDNLSDKIIIFINTQHYKKEFEHLANFFKLKEPELNKSLTWDVHIYVSPEENCGSLKPHFDEADNFILQCEGVSRWIVPNFFDIILEPGDIAFIPKYCVHQCIPLSKRISLSFSFWY
jgi:ribosomal protein L16 Arg81 hydroxylase